ncbi:coiled-coil domain-containing protein 134 [Neodiprion lecontei]|uniref:Coiled-coil domain-containing protein 134 n=1 Tax=Neodiprion lecontei TaxID=441921 RepID=A0A6J0CB78_NEOLC|nr:coiled-coil domain-containing protein 134 [Neodiprion lecontei]
MQTPKMIAFYLPVFVASCTAQVQNTTPARPIGVGESTAGDSVQTDPNELLFKRLFARRREEHVEAVRGLRKMENYERQYKMIMVLAEKVFSVIQTSRDILESAEFEPGNTPFPEDANLRDALSNILENTALFGDIILHLPEISQRVLNTQPQWDTMMQWSWNFANQTRHLLDKSTNTMIHLVGQELNITTREPGYFNPYWSNAAGESIHNEDTNNKQKKRSKKEKRKKGPRMTRMEL